MRKAKNYKRVALTHWSSVLSLYVMEVIELLGLGKLSAILQLKIAHLNLAVQLVFKSDPVVCNVRYLRVELTDSAVLLR